MKLTPTQARNMIAKELEKGNGIYIDGRFFEVRVQDGVLQVSDFRSWFDVKAGSVFRNGHGRDLFSYEPEQGPLKPFINGKWHAWQGTASILLSDEDVNTLREFETVDACINWLFTNDNKDAARALNAHVKGVN